MFKFVTLILVLSSTINCQAPADFSAVIANVINQWGQVSPGTWQELFHNFTQGGSIWHGLNEHCSSNIQCGAEACCLKPNINGRRAITDGNIVHFGSYCSKLRNLGETCSIHDNNKPYYNSHCPCVSTSKCVPGSTISPHPLIVIPTSAVCK